MLSMQVAREFHQARKSMEAREKPPAKGGEREPLQLSTGDVPWAGKTKLRATPGLSDFESQLMERAMMLSSAPARLRAVVLLLAVLPPDTPVPMVMLQNLWANILQAEEFASTVQDLEEEGYVVTAQPTENSLWVLVDSGVQEHLQAWPCPCHLSRSPLLPAPRT